MSDLEGLVKDLQFHPSSLPKNAVLVGFFTAIGLSVIGTILNLLTLFTFCTCKKLQQYSTTSFVISLTVSDLLYCLVCLPITADTFAQCRICHVDWLCRVYAFAFYWNITAMVLNQCAVAFNRFITVCFPVKTPIKFTGRNNVILIFFMWFVPFLSLLAPLLDLWGSLGFDGGTGTCTFLNDPIYGPLPRRVYFAIGLGIPTLIILFCYVNIYITFKKSSQRIREQANGNLNSSHLESSANTTPSSPVEGEDYEMGDVPQCSNGQQLEDKRVKALKTPGKKLIWKGEINEPPQVSELSASECISVHYSTSDAENEIKGPSIHRRRYSEAVCLSIKERDLRRDRNEQKMTLTLFAIFVAFVTCTVPPALILGIDPKADEYPHWHIPLYILGWLFGVINPIIYVAFNQTYREAFVSTVHTSLKRCSRIYPEPV